jgi:menaquinone-9 beta-reductase
MKSCDVLIVGGGPAGSSCARALRAGGLDVIVMDRKEFPRKKVCAGWITPEVFQSLHIDVQDYARGRVCQPIDGFRVGLLGRKQLHTAYGFVVSYGILRCEFDDYLLQRSGARLQLGEEFKSVSKHGQRFRVNDTIDAGLVIGAGGHFCPIARHLGAKKGKESFVTAQEIEVEMTPEQARSCKIEAQVPELFVCHDLLGYGWCFRKGDHLNIGFGRQDRKGTSELTQELFRFLKSSGRIPEDTSGTFHGHAYILYGRTKRELLGDGMMLIGDAAGLAYPESGEGIRTGIESGLLAAETVLAAKGDFSRARLEPYVERLISRYGKLQTYPPSGVPAAIHRALMRSKWYSRHVLLDWLILHRHQPALVSALARAEAPTSQRARSVA